MDKEMLEQESRIYGKSNENLTQYQKSMNDAAFVLCCKNTQLLKNKSDLIQLARKKLDDDGYNYAKKRSRSKAFGTGLGKNEVAMTEQKKHKLTQELRQKKVSEVTEDIESMKKVVSYLENERIKLVNMQKYAQAAQVLEQITEKRREQRKLTEQLTLIQAKEAKSKAYHQKKDGLAKMKKRADSLKKDRKQGSLNSFLKHSGSTSTCTTVEPAGKKEYKLPTTDQEPLTGKSPENNLTNKTPTCNEVEKESNDQPSFLLDCAPHHVGQ